MADKAVKLTQFSRSMNQVKTYSDTADTNLKTAVLNEVDNKIEDAIDPINDKVIPAGGTAGQILAKKTATDNDTEWIDPPTSSGTVDSIAWSNVTGKPAFADVATSGSYDDLSNKPTIPSAYDDSALTKRVNDLETDVNDLKTNGASVTVDSTLSDTSENPVQNKVIKAALDGLSVSGVVVDTALSDTSENPVQNKVIKAALDDKADSTDIPDVSGKANTADLAAVATSGAYADLTGTPTIPSAYDDTAIRALIAGKQDAETGKGLSTNDYTSDEKAKLAALPTNTALQSALDGKQDAGNYTLNGSGAMPGGQPFAGGVAVGYFRESNINKGIIISGSAANAISETAPLEYLRFNRSSKKIEHMIYDGTNWSTVMTFTADEDTGWQTLEPIDATKVASNVSKIRRKNGVVYVSFNFTLVPAGSGGQDLFDIPAGFRSSIRVDGHISVTTNGKDTDAFIYGFTTNGKATIYATNGWNANSACQGFACYPV